MGDVRRSCANYFEGICRPEPKLAVLLGSFLVSRDMIYIFPAGILSCPVTRITSLAAVKLYMAESSNYCTAVDPSLNAHMPGLDSSANGCQKTIGIRGLLRQERIGRLR